MTEDEPQQTGRACWCGNRQLTAFSPEYARCAVCGTLVTLAPATRDLFDVQDDAHDFYGREYWLRHQEQDLHTPGIETRARRDLPERCLHWLRTLVAFRLPPARVLEVGAAHGGFVAMMRWAGFDAQGVELSPWVVEFARRTFGVPMRRGPLDAQDFEPASFDIVVMNDVLEHLPDPVAVMRHAASLLAPDGIFVIQMPRYEEDVTYEQLLATNARFLQHIEGMGAEHQHLFSRRAAERLFGELGFAHLAFEQPMFPYDMFFVASRRPLVRLGAEEMFAALLGSPSGRLVTALLDIDRERHAIQLELAGAREDGAQRLANMQILQQLLDEANADREQRLENMNELTQLLQEANRDRQARLEQITTLTEQVIATNRQLDLTAQSVNDLQQLIETRRHEFERRPDWPRQMDTRLITHMPRDAARAASGPDSPTGTGASLPLIAVDLTPILPGGENGGAKQLVIELLNGFAGDTRHRYLLLTTAANHGEFARYEARGMRRLLLEGETVAPSSWRARFARLVSRGLSAAGVKGRLAAQGVDLLFCPMTDPIHAEPGIPTVCIVYDLQHVAYPSFFTPQEREHRTRFFERVTRTADAAICISEFTRRVLIEHSRIDESRAVAIPIAVHHRLQPAAPEQVQAVRRTFNLDAAPYALFPANFWPHKNHRMLLVAFGAFLREHPESSLHLVLVGDTLTHREEIAAAIEGMGLSSRVHILGYVSDEQLAALWTDAVCLLFPSLYEGFGIPVLEAMHFGTPVICSEVASLPEVGGDAVLYIDPRKPETLVSALARLTHAPELRAELSARGRQRAELFPPAAMVARYLEVFERVLGTGGQVQVARVDGVFGDRWVAPEAVALTGASPTARQWDFELQAPEWHPHERTTIRVEVNGRSTQKLSIERGTSRQVVVPVPPAGARVRLALSPFFVPSTAGDTRQLTVLLTRGRLVDAESGTVAYEL